MTTTHLLHTAHQYCPNLIYIVYITMLQVIKDGFGQLGGVIFAGLVNNQYDSDPKRWRLLSSVAMEVSSGIEILTPLAPGYFLPMVSCYRCTGTCTCTLVV
mgnify:CR=1 FL=1